MKALTWQGRRDVRVDNVPEPAIEQPTDAIIKVTSSGICGSDLHLYEVMGPFIDAGDVAGAVRELTGGAVPDAVIDAVGTVRRSASWPSRRSGCCPTPWRAS
jgi:threonine dehydrogenase-like Zn-dependent dehydrogenase